MSGACALLLLSQNKPDLVLLDLMLPGLSGEEVLPKIQGIPVIVVRAKVDVQDKVNLLLGGAADYITKPFDITIHVLWAVPLGVQPIILSKIKDMVIPGQCTNWCRNLIFCRGRGVGAAEIGEHHARLL